METRQRDKGKIRFVNITRNPDGLTYSDGSTIVCQRCRVIGKRRRRGEEENGKDVITRGKAATWMGDREERDGRLSPFAYCDAHFRWWNERRLGEGVEEEE